MQSLYNADKIHDCLVDIHVDSIKLQRKKVNLTVCVRVKIQGHENPPSLGGLISQNGSLVNFLKVRTVRAIAVCGNLISLMLGEIVIQKSFSSCPFNSAYVW